MYKGGKILFISKGKLPVHKKVDKQCLQNYRTISMLASCSKIFKLPIYNELFTFFTDNKFISSNQSGFRSDDTCFNQLLAITHEIYKLVHDGLEIRELF